MKETLTDKLIKRFYGITGPLDEFRRQQVERVGNMCFIWLFYIIAFGNLIAFFLGREYPEVVAIAYPFALTIIILFLYFVVATKQNVDIVQTIDVEELDEKEKVQLKQVGWKSGLFFGLIMWFFGPLVLDMRYIDGLFTPKILMFGCLCGLMFGLLMHLLVKARQK